MLLVLTGKTAAGKDTIQSRLQQYYPNLKRIITTTSRKIRNSETDGVDYYFISREDFEEKIKNDQFFEYVEYGGNLYGTLKSEMEEKKDLDTIWRIDPSRAGQIREFVKAHYSPDTAQRIIDSLLVIFITTSDEAILQRLKARNLDEKEIEKRLKDDKQIWEKYQDKYDFVIENIPGQLDQAVAQIIKLIEEHKIPIN